MRLLRLVEERRGLALALGMDVFERVADRREVDGQLRESLGEQRELRGDLVRDRPRVKTRLARC